MFEDLVSGAPADDVMDVDGRGAAPATTPSQVPTPSAALPDLHEAQTKPAMGADAPRQR